MRSIPDVLVHRHRIVHLPPVRPGLTLQAGEQKRSLQDSTKVSIVSVSPGQPLHTGQIVFQKASWRAGGPRRWNVPRQDDGQVLLGDGNRPALLAVDHGDRRPQ